MLVEKKLQKKRLKQKNCEDADSHPCMYLGIREDIRSETKRTRFKKKKKKKDE